jgi:hypothetical protein
LGPQRGSPAAFGYPNKPLLDGILAVDRRLNRPQNPARRVLPAMPDASKRHLRPNRYDRFLPKTEAKNLAAIARARLS